MKIITNVIITLFYKPMLQRW